MYSLDDYISLITTFQDSVLLTEIAAIERDWTVFSTTSHSPFKDGDSWAIYYNALEEEAIKRGLK